jgi:hypothetical protein
MMRNLLALLAALLLILGGLGWYLDWFKLKQHPAEPGHNNVSIDINTQKIGQDSQKFEQKVHQFLENATKEKDKPPDAKVPGKASASRSELGTAPRGGSESSEPPLPPGNVFGPAIPPPGKK